MPPKSILLLFFYKKFKTELKAPSGNSGNRSGSFHTSFQMQHLSSVFLSLLFEGMLIKVLFNAGNYFYWFIFVRFRTSVIYKLHLPQRIFKINSFVTVLISKFSIYCLWAFSKQISKCLNTAYTLNAINFKVSVARLMLFRLISLIFRTEQKSETKSSN